MYGDELCKTQVSFFKPNFLFLHCKENFPKKQVSYIHKYLMKATPHHAIIMRETNIEGSQVSNGIVPFSVMPGQTFHDFNYEISIPHNEMLPNSIPDLLAMFEI